MSKAQVFFRDHAQSSLEDLRSRLSGQLATGLTMRRLYATDASEYQEMPLGVAFPETEQDVREIVLFAARHRIGIIPRTAGTSLAGQVAGNGLAWSTFRRISTRSSASTACAAACACSPAWCATS